jgi:PAS domain S-box-containing protein
MNNHVEVLIVEDSPTQREQLQHLLEEAGYAVRGAGNGQEALESMQARKPTLVISDVVMPGMDGYAFCKEVKSRPELKDIPVILVTALSSPQDVINGLQSGADNFVRKPYDARELLSRINYILTNQHVRSESKVQAGVQIAFGGQKYFITAERQQILDLLIATYDDAVALNAQLVSKQWEIARSNEILHALYRMADSLNRSVNVQEVLETPLSLALELPGIQAAWVSLWDAKRGFRLGASRNLPPALESPDAWKDDCLCQRMMLAGEMPKAVNILECERLQKSSGDTKGLRFHASVPLRAGNRVLGVLNLAGPDEGMIREGDLELLGGVGNQLASALERAQLLENLEWRVEERTAALEAEFAERQRAEEALRRSEVRFRRLAESSMLGVVQAHFDGRVLDANDAFLRMVGYARHELEAGLLRWDEMILPEYRQLNERLMDEIKASGASTPAEEELLRKDGSRVPVLLGGALLEGSPDEIIGFALDISNRKLLEEQLRQASKMEAVGRLAGGVAHDFNNLLTIINGYAELMLSQFSSDHPARSQAEEIKKAGERAAALTRQLLAFGRRQVLAPQILDLNDIVGGVEKMLRRLIGEDIDLVFIPKEPLGAVKADPGQIEQVLMNLAVNSRDAMPKGGKLTIETAEIELDEAYCRSHAHVAPGPHVMLAVSDTGVGMDKETQARIFEPFFTTKEKGKGTGLGLATVYGIVKQSGGHIWLYSEPGRGTTFKIYLPRVQETVGKPVSPAEGTASGAGSETILVVEDEEALRVMACDILRSKGYRILQAKDGQEALSTLQSSQGPIQLLLTDVVMPGMSGKELVDSSRALHREMQVLYMSGYTDNSVVHHGVLDPGTEFLQKPFTPDALLRKVRKVLDSVPPGPTRHESQGTGNRNRRLTRSDDRGPEPSRS